MTQPVDIKTLEQRHAFYSEDLQTFYSDDLRQAIVNDEIDPFKVMLDDLRFNLDYINDPVFSDGIDRSLSLLMIAAAYNSKNIAAYLLSKGAKPDVVSPVDRFNALMQSARHGAVDVMQLLLDAGANIDTSHPTRCSPVQLAAYQYASEGESEHLTCMKLLAERGADLNQGCPASEYADRYPTKEDTALSILHDCGDSSALAEVKAIYEALQLKSMAAKDSANHKKETSPGL